MRFWALNSDGYLYALFRKDPPPDGAIHTTVNNAVCWAVPNSNHHPINAVLNQVPQDNKWHRVEFRLVTKRRKDNKETEK